MFTFLFLLGLILVAGALLPFFINVRMDDTREKHVNEDRKYAHEPEFIETGYDASPKALRIINKKTVRVGLIAFGIFFLLSRGLFFWADATEQYFLVYPTGSTGVVTTQGVKFRGFAKITPWLKYIDVKVADEGDDTDDIEGLMKPIDIRFIDQVTATVLVSTRFQLPEDEVSFKKLAVKFRSMKNLVENTLKPSVREQVNNTGYMFKAQDYISGEAQNFRQTLDEQLKDGAYKVEKLVDRDTIFEGDKSRKIKEIKTTYNVEKVEKDGKPVRIPHEITSNNIIVSQVIVDDVMLEGAFKQRLEAQRDEAAKRQLEQQKIETAKNSQLRIIAEGERDKAAERVAQEKNQVKTLIAIETKLKQEKTNKELALIQKETEKINSDKRMIKADADAYEIAKKVRAGITPEVRLKMELDAQVRIAAEIAKLKFPTTMIIGGEDGGGTPLESLIGAAMAKQLGVKTK